MFQTLQHTIHMNYGSWIRTRLLLGHTVYADLHTGLKLRFLRSSPVRSLSKEKLLFVDLGVGQDTLCPYVP